MFDIRFKGLRIEPTLSASRELVQEKKDLYDVLEILEDGYESSASKRKENIIERSLKKGNKEYKADVAYPDGFSEEVWRLIHFGKITYTHGQNLLSNSCPFVIQRNCYAISCTKKRKAFFT